MNSNINLEQPTNHELRPKHEDILKLDSSKLHSEINQYINQTLVITTTSITIFGVVMGWIVSGISTAKESVKIQTEPLTLFLPAALLIVLIVMCWYCRSVTEQMHVLSTYLIERRLSIWEREYQKFAESSKNQDRFPLVVFGVLGALTISIPTTIYVLFPPDPSNLALNSIISGIFILTSITFVIIFCFFWRRKPYEVFRNEATALWKSIPPEIPPD